MKNKNASYFDEYILTLKSLVSFRSVSGEKTDGAPFGKDVRGALRFFLDTARDMGFTVTDYDGYAGEISFGSGEEVGIIGHIDVVPEGGGWNTEPYTLTLKDGEYCGRGVLDDKGPLLASLFALKELKDFGVSPKRKFRLFIGTNEETGWKDAEYLKAHTTLPEYGFSPDGNFPVSYAEKGMAVVGFKIPALKNFYDLKGGTVINAVCDLSRAKSKIKPDEKLLKKYGLKYNGKEIESFGKAAHGSRPDLGKNAIKPLFEYFKACGEDVGDVIDCLFNDRGNLKNFKTEQGDITFSPDLLYEKDGYVYIKCDCRFPYPIEEKTLTSVFDTFGLDYEMTVKHGTQYVEKDGFLVKTLLSAYKSVMGGDPKPISQGGSTFARVFKKGVAFGPEFPDLPSTIHEPNERVKKEDLEKIYEIYKKAIFSLAKGE